MTSTWFVTGASSGIGASIVSAALAHGDKVIAASRNSLKLDSLKAKGAITVDFDVNASASDIKAKVNSIIKENGPIDVVVNNAGYGQFGSIEEAGPELFEKQYATNVFGPVKVITAFLPHLRSKKSGLFINIGSRAAYDYLAFGGAYDSSKAALQNISATLDQEVTPLGIRSVLVEPGVFRTSFLTAANLKEDSTVFPSNVSDYDEARKPIQKFASDFDKKQACDPDILSKHLVDLAHKSGSFAKEVPSIITFGQDSIDSITNYAKGNLERIEKWKDVILSTDRHDW